MKEEKKIFVILTLVIGFIFVAALGLIKVAVNINFNITDIAACLFVIYEEFKHN